MSVNFRICLSLLLVVALSGQAKAASRFQPDFEPATGVFRFDLPAGQAASGAGAAEPLVVLPVSLNGEPQSDFRSVRGRANALQNDLLSVEWTQVAPHAVAVTWIVRKRTPGEFAIRIADDSDYYGGGERFQALNQKGYILPMASQDHPEAKGTATYKPVPFYLSTAGYGVWVDSYAPGQFDLNATDRFHTILRYTTDRLRIVIIDGNTPRNILATFTELSGRIRVPPPWSFAPWKSRDVHRNRDEVLEDIALLRRHDLPASVLVIDSPWETGYNNFALNEKQFAEPDAMFSEIERQGFYVSLWLTPFVNSRSLVDMPGIAPGASSNYREAAEKGFLVGTADGGVMTAEWWKGEGGLVDFTNPEAVEWWHGQLDKTRRWRIVRSFKADDGEGNFVGNASFHDGSDAAEMKNRYAGLYLGALQSYIDSRLDGDGVLLARPGFTGTHRYPVSWSGDNAADFSYANGLPSVIIAAQNAGLSGLPLTGHDIAGYFGRPDKELFVRWTQFGAFSPLMMVHMTSNLGPWDFDAETLVIYRKFAKLHTALFPYIYEATHEARRTGLPIVRAMVLAYPDEPDAAAHPYQYLFGPDLLVAPMYRGGTKRTVWLPPGAWVDYWSGVRFTGSRTIEVEAPLAEVPLFVRTGALIPMLPGDVDTLIRRNDAIAHDVVTLDERRVIEVWAGDESAFSTWEGLTGSMNTDGTGGRLTIASRNPFDVRVRFPHRAIGELVDGERRHRCEVTTQGSTCRIGELRGETELVWSEAR